MFFYDSGSQESFYEMQNRVNRKLKAVRRGGIVLAVCLIVLGIALMICPQSVVTWVERGIAMVLGLTGILEVIDYFTTTALFRQSFTIARGVGNLLIAVLLLMMDTQTIMTLLAVILGLMLCLIGVHKMDFAAKLNYFRVSGGQASVLAGVLTLIAGIGFLVSPLLLTSVATMLIGLYCVIGGIALLAEMLSFVSL